MRDMRQNMSSEILHPDRSSAELRSSKAPGVSVLRRIKEKRRQRGSVQGCSGEREAELHESLFFAGCAGCPPQICRVDGFALLIHLNRFAAIQEMDAIVAEAVVDEFAAEAWTVLRSPGSILPVVDGEPCLAGLLPGDSAGLDGVFRLREEIPGIHRIGNRIRGRNGAHRL